MSGEPKYGEWQPIETAPTDGTHILIGICEVIDGEPYVLVDQAYYYPFETDTYKERDDGLFEKVRFRVFEWSSEKIRRPTHWMPLPEPPQ